MFTTDLSKHWNGRTTLDLLQDAIAEAPMKGRERVLRRLPELFESHIKNICQE